MSSPIPQTGDQILRLPSVIVRTGLSRSALYDLMSKDDFVRPIHLTARAIGFLQSEVEAWIQHRAASRDNGRAPSLDPQTVQIAAARRPEL